MRDEIVTYDVKNSLSKLVAEFPGITEISLFGSRVYQTGSLRSDCDLLVEYEPDAAPKAGDLLRFSDRECSAFDFFLLHHGQATSCANQSFIYANSSEELKQRVDSKTIWSREAGFSPAGPFYKEQDPWAFSVHGHIVFIPTALPNAVITENTLRMTLARAEHQGLPTQPFLGDNVEAAAMFLKDVARNLVMKPSDLGQRGAAKSGWTVNLKSEYDCQNLFFITVKPWLRSIGREEVEITYDEQKKISDFNAFENQLIVEMKYIDDPNSKREVLKDLKGLQHFYSKNQNVRILLFVIYYKTEAQVDAPRWEQDYSSAYEGRRIVTSLVQLP